jgi:galactonate dehydratase
MKIDRIETFLVRPRWLFVRIETDAGIVGWGEPTLEGRCASVAAAIEEMSELLIGADALRIEDTWQLLSKTGFYRGGPVFSSAVAGIDQALWDIAGRHLGVPAYQLLGGPVRDSAMVYSWIGGDRPHSIADDVAARLAQGLVAVKMNASPELRAIESPGEVSRIVARAAEVRDALGPDRDFALDFHGRFSPAMAMLVLPELEPLRPMFVEEPVVPELVATQLRRVVDASRIPIATGERAYSRWDFAPILEAGAAVVQPDVSHAGGISETRRVAAQAEIYGASIAPHSPLGPIALAASLQIAYSSINFLIQEQSRSIHYNEQWDVIDYLVDTSVFDLVDGAIPRSDAPGLGLDLDEKAVRAAAATGHRWRAPVWRHKDGSLAEW